ncbi:hypothetical protein SESBI_20999 [Sesbania bispinosa]|nr:hypothetical protein SESBI_20999 [Sesbania bispinosa]
MAISVTRRTVFDGVVDETATCLVTFGEKSSTDQLPVTAKELRGASGVKLAAMILEDGEDGGVLAEGSNLLLGEKRREAVENGVVEMEDTGWFGELRGVPVVVSGEDGRLGFRINPEDEGFGKS